MRLKYGYEWDNSISVRNFVSSALAEYFTVYVTVLVKLLVVCF
jgi:hypothetical protein